MSGVEVNLTDRQRERLEGLLRKFARADYKGALVAHISTTGQTMMVVYVEPPTQAKLRRVLQAGRDRVSETLRKVA